MAVEAEVRTRVAPSPTGDPHIGTAYMALFNYCLAKRHGGQFVLRIEDTDRACSTPESERAIFESLRWVGLEWDEGPDVGGPHGPYRQSERTEIYREHCETLLNSGHAYRCFCTAEDIEQRRQAAPADERKSGYDKHCAQLSDSDVHAKLDAGLPHVVRLRVPAEGECVMQDLLRGDVATPWHSVDDQVLMKSDGFPTYHLANVVDDHLMGITHVVRGEEWIPSGPKHLLLYEHFGWKPPIFCHLPLLRNPDKSKLSKRKNPTSILYYRRAGFLPEALLNYLGLMGYTLASGEELFSLEEMVETFDIERVSLGGPIFDAAKLSWLNGRYIRERHDTEGLLGRLREWQLNDDTWKAILPLAQPRIEKLTDLVPLTAFFFADGVVYDPQLLIAKDSDGAQVARLLLIAIWEMEKISPWDQDALQACIQKIAEKEGLRIRDAVAPLYVALTGERASTPLFESMALLGSDLTRRRLHLALEVLDEAGFPLKGKQLKKLQKYYQAEY